MESSPITGAMDALALAAAIVRTADLMYTFAAQQIQSLRCYRIWAHLSHDKCDDQVRAALLFTGTAPP